MVSRFAADPNCKDCGRKKGPRQIDQMRCFTCQRIVKAAAANRSHGLHILTTYGITSEEYTALWQFQGGKCAICVKASGATRRLAVDHNHKCPTKSHDPKLGCPECVRGLLCGKCNVFLGYIRDDASIGGRIGRYLTEPPFQLLRAKMGLAA